MDIRYNISELFQVAFGINSPVFIPEPLLKSPPVNINYSGLVPLDENYAGENGFRTMSWMGTPIVFPVKFKGKEYQLYNGLGEIIKTRLNDYQLPAATLLSFRRAKNITRTNLLGSNGTVKEIYGMDDWVIDVKGLCLDEPGNPAADQLAKLLRWEELADAIEVRGSLFSSLKISAVAMLDFQKDGTQAKPGVIPFQFQLLSDEAVELVISGL